jgi:hypothetical protein
MILSSPPPIHAFAYNMPNLILQSGQLLKGGDFRKIFIANYINYTIYLINKSYTMERLNILETYGIVCNTIKANKYEKYCIFFISQRQYINVTTTTYLMGKLFHTTFTTVYLHWKSVIPEK